MDDACLLNEDPAQLAEQLDQGERQRAEHWQHELDRARRGLPLELESE